MKFKTCMFLLLITLLSNLTYAANFNTFDISKTAIHENIGFNEDMEIHNNNMKKRCYTKPFLNSNGKVILNSIAIIEKVLINGLSHGLIIRGENINNPVLLYLHGGHGRSENSTYFRKISRSLEKSFTKSNRKAPGFIHGI